MKTNDWKLIAAVLIAILAASIAEARRPGQRDGTVSPDQERTQMMQTTPMQKPRVFDPYRDRRHAHPRCRVVQTGVLHRRGVTSSVVLCAAPDLRSLRQIIDRDRTRRP